MVACNLQLDEGAHFQPAAKQFSLKENGENSNLRLQRLKAPS
jgi:hypothetical protein